MIRQNKKRILLIKKFKKDILGNVILKKKKILIKNFLYSLKKKKSLIFIKLVMFLDLFILKEKQNFVNIF